MTFKIRVKDLSAELGVTNKELLQALRDLDISVKSHMSSITEDDATLVRSKFKESVGEAPDVIEKKVQPGVIVRRRRQAPAAKPAKTAAKPAKPTKPTKPKAKGGVTAGGRPVVSGTDEDI